MRTLSSILGLRASKTSQRYYSAEGSICFELVSANVEPNLSKLRQMIVEIDERFPWRATNGFGEEQRSIGYLDDGHVVTHNFHVPIKMCWFWIVPMLAIQKGQIHAYEKYLDKIAEELAALQMPGVRGVHAVMRVASAGPEFKTGGAIC